MPIPFKKIQAGWNDTQLKFKIDLCKRLQAVKKNYKERQGEGREGDPWNIKGKAPRRLISQHQSCVIACLACISDSGYINASSLHIAVYRR